MKTLLFTILTSQFCYSQQLKENYITYSNFANEAEYHFHEGHYDSVVYYFELGLEYTNNPHPMMLYKYAKSLWKIGDRQKSIEMLESNCMPSKIDTTWFQDLSKSELESISKKIKANDYNLYNQQNVIRGRSFIDSIMILDQKVRNEYHENNPVSVQNMRCQDSTNEIALIDYTKKYGFPTGINCGWNQNAATLLLHMSPEWFEENFSLLYNEVVKGNLEPWMLARGIDRMYTIEIGEDLINPYNRYHTKSIINPFLMFYNCTSLGVSPYYDFNWKGSPHKTIHFEYYKEHKQFYNTAFIYLPK